MAKMMDCPYCGKLTDPNLSNCPHCGGSLAHKNVVPKRVSLGRGRQTCPTCKALVQDGDIICVACGTNLLTGQKVTEDEAPVETRSWELPPPRVLVIAGGVVLVIALLAIWTLLLSRDPKSRAARLIEEGSYIEAAEVLEEYVDEQPDDSEARMTLGQLQYRNNRFASAASSFEEALRLHPTDKRAAYWALASVAREGGDDDFTRRGRLVERIVEIDPSDQNAWYLLSLITGARGDHDASRDALEQFQRAGGDGAIFEWNRGLTMARSGEFASADSAFDSVIGTSRDADAKAAQAMLAALRGQFTIARNALADVADSPGLTIDWEAKTELGKLHLAHGDFRRAVDALDSALAANPSNPPARYFRGLAHSASRREQQAMQDFEFLVNAGGQFAYEAALEAARIQLRENDPGRASEYLARASRVNNVPTADFMLLQGLAALGQNNQREAERSFNRAVELDRGLAEVYLERGLLYVQQNRIQPGISDLQRYVQLVNTSMAGTEVAQIRELIRQLKSTNQAPAASISMQGGRD